MAFLCLTLFQKPNNAVVLLFLPFCLVFVFCDIVNCVLSSLLIISLRQSYFCSKFVLAYLCILVNMWSSTVAFCLSVVCDYGISVPLT